MAEETRLEAGLTLTTFDVLHDAYAKRQAQANELHMLRHLLSVIDPQPGDHMLDALGILQRLHTVIGARLQQEKG